MKLSILTFLVCVTCVSSSGYQCQGPIKISPPDDLTRTVYWPSIWNDSMPPIPIATQQNCKWEIAVPDGLYATAVFYKNAKNNVAIAVGYPNGLQEGLDNMDYNPYIFTSPQFLINLYKSAGDGSFSFKVTWSKYPNVAHDTVQLLKNDKPFAMAPNTHLTTFNAETTVGLVAFTLRNQSHYPLLRQSAVYDGDSTSGAFIGTLYSIMMLEKEVVSSGKTLTVFTWGLLNELFDYTLFMVQDHANEPYANKYRGWNCYSDTECSFQMIALTGTSVIATSDSRPEFIKSIGIFPSGATLKIYEGRIGNDSLVTTLT